MARTSIHGSLTGRVLNPSAQKPKSAEEVEREKIEKFNDQLRRIRARAPKPDIPEEIQRVKEAEMRNLPAQKSLPAPVGERMKKRTLENKRKRGKTQA